MPTPPVSPELELDPARLELLRARRTRRLEVVGIPLLRLAGFAFLALAVHLHNRYILQDPSLTTTPYALGVLAYSLASWALIVLLYPRVPQIGRFFLTFDLVPWTLALVVSGGPRSWLYPVLILRAADQVGAGFKRTAALGGLSVACYATMLLLWPQPVTAAGWVQLGLIAFANLYLSLTARTVDSLRERTREAMRLARESVLDLERHLEERERMEEERIRTQKLEGLSALAGGVAHDFNNLLTAVLGNVSLLKLRDPGGNYDLIDDVERACLRARDLTRQLLGFSKASVPVRRVFDPGPVIRDTAVFALRGTNARCEVDLPDDLWRLDADEAQVAQVVQNLALNAAQAMPGGGTVRLTAGNVPTDPPQVRISVQDHGPGIPAEHVQTIFDPYFTTKPEGSGLGLTTCHSIVTRHGGRMDLDTGPRGTTFHVFLPASHAPPTQHMKNPAVGIPGGGRVLVMDDDPSVRRVAGLMLRHLGYDPEFACDGQEALQRYRDAESPWAAVIFDLTVPGGMGGKDAIRHLLQIDPEVRAVVSSGYSEDPVMNDFRTYGFRGMLAKPYTLQELASALDSVVEA